MIDFDVQLTHPAIRDIREISEDAHSRIIDGIIGLRQDPFPFPPLKKKLKGFAFPLYRLRVADCRILYRIDKTTVTILRVVDRKDLEKAIKHLNR